MRLIDADQIRIVYMPIAPFSAENDVHYEPIAYAWEIDRLPTVDAKPVIHAHWIPEYPNKRTGKAYSHKCSGCKKTVYNNWQVSVDELGYVFCPYCGAKMDEE